MSHTAEPAFPPEPFHVALAARNGIIPWWRDLEVATLAELGLGTVEQLEPNDYDLVVVGAGVAGLSAALAASRVGARVLVLEREQSIGYGATGQNAGILSAGVNMSVSDLPRASAEAAFWPETTALLRELVNEAAQPGSLLKAQLTGALSLAETAAAARRLAQEARARIALGLRAELWKMEQVAEMTRGRLDVTSVVCALWLPEEGRVQPLTLLAHLACRVRAAGGRLVGGADVLTFQKTRTRGRVAWHLVLANGQHLTARALIQATGPTIHPNARIYALAFAADLPADFPLFWDAAPYIYADFRPGNGRLTVSGGRYGRAGAARRDAIYYQRLVNTARHWLPELVDVEPLATWAVDLDVSAEMVPQLRPLDARPSMGFAIVGLGALGVLPGILLGRRAAHLLVEQWGRG